jgi:hypothetical protein
MKTGMRVLIIITEKLNQAGKITVLRVTEGVRPKLEISRIHGKIHHCVWAFLLSKNAIFHKNPLIILPVTRRNHALPTG